MTFNKYKMTFHIHKKMKNYPIELTLEERKLITTVKKLKLTLVSEERLWATAMACKHVINENIEGAFVEAGVWRGGNAILAAAMFKLNNVDKKVYLYDTFAGMTEPTDEDIDNSSGKSAMKIFLSDQRDSHNDWCYCSIEDVKNNFLKLNLLDNNVIFVQGDVVKTLKIPENLPDNISILRLDTDWYESTKVELEVLYPLLSTGGQLIVDDYGHWAGSKKAVDEYFVENGNRPFFQYTDYTGRSATKHHHY